MADPTDELEPLFDYSRVQPCDIVCLDDSSPAFLPKRRKRSNNSVEKVDKNGKLIQVIDCKENKEDDWLPPPPKVLNDAREFGENSTIKELRLKKQELASFAKSTNELLRSVEQTTKIDFNTSLQSTIESAADQSTSLFVKEPK